MAEKEIELWKKSGKIAAEIMQKARKFVKPGMPLLEIAEMIENEVEKRKVSFAFPVNLSLNETAAHSSPTYDDKRIAEGILKIDIGISVDGYISDTASSIDLTPDKRFSKLIKASEDALNAAAKMAKAGTQLQEIGAVIQETINKAGFAPVANLSGHGLERWRIHAEPRVPNYNNHDSNTLKEGQIIAIEPFATDGEGMVEDGKPSGVYMLLEKKPARGKLSREILEFIEKNYNTLPFSARWLVNNKKFGSKSLFALKELQNLGILHQFPQLIEKAKGNVSHSEHTFFVKKNGLEILTKRAQ